MSSKRRTFHVDWDSPSTETGTVKRRPISLTETFSSKGICFENVEYYEVRNFVGGFDLHLLDSFEDPTTRDRSERVEKSLGLRKNEETSKELCENAKKSLKKIGSRERNVSTANRSSARNSVSLFGSLGEGSGSRTKDPEIFKPKGSRRRSLNLENYKGPPRNVCQAKPPDSVQLRPQKQVSKLAVRKDFGLKLSKDPLTWKFTKCNKNASAWKQLPPECNGTLAKSPGASQRKSAIPKPKLTRSLSSKSRGLVNSSSESSGFGSPLSPLSPLQKDNTACDDPEHLPENSEGTITNSSSKSSGLGSPDSPDSPLSPDSQQYAALYLIQQQLEKLHNCPCERRQAQVYDRTHFTHFIGY